MKVHIVTERTTGRPRSASPQFSVRAWLHLNACVDALMAGDRERWARMREGLELFHGGEAPADVAQRIAATQRAIDGGDPRIPQALARCWIAYEACWWADPARAAREQP